MFGDRDQSNNIGFAVAFSVRKAMFIFFNSIFFFLSFFFFWGGIDHCFTLILKTLLIFKCGSKMVEELLLWFQRNGVSCLQKPPWSIVKPFNL